MNKQSIAPLSDSDIEWRPFTDNLTEDSIDDVLLVLDEDEVRHYCRELRADIRAVSDALHEAVAMLAVVTTQRDRARERNRQLREWNETLVVAAQIFQRETAA